MKSVVSDVEINNFRGLVDSNSSFVYQIYKDRGGKNHYNLVCSAMDWISVSVGYLQNAPEFDSNIDIKCMQVYSLISSIDLIFESIKQLHRVFMTDKKDPFYGEKKCFKDRLFADEDDNNYFKTIRACFGAHPVNLKQDNSKRFASWPFLSLFNSGDLSVRLYSRDVGKEDLTLNLNIHELLEFLKIRYEYLDIIADRIETQFVNYQYELSREKIETKSDPLEQLYILHAKSKERLNNDYYNDEISDLVMIFEAGITDTDLVPLVDKYKQSLLPLIEEIKTNLQEMNIVDLENDSGLRIRSDLDKELRYALDGFYSWVHGGGYDPLLEYYFEIFNASTDNKFKFSKTDNIKLTFLKAKLMLTE